MDLQVYRNTFSTGQCEYVCWARTVAQSSPVSVAVSGGGFDGSETDWTSNQVTYEKTRIVADRVAFDVESGHGAGASLSSGCKRCKSGRFQCPSGSGSCDPDGSGGSGGSGSGGGTGPFPGKRLDDDCISPIIIDLDRNRFHFSGVDGAVYFDMFGDGNALLMNWIMPGQRDAFLFRDINQNGIVDDGSELFGDGTIMLLENGFAPNGFVALSQHDEAALGGNDDGYITPQDLVWEELFLWVDDNADGICLPSEVMVPERESLVSIETIPTHSRQRDGHGNLLKFWAEAHTSGRSEYAMVDVYFLHHGQ